MKTQCAHPRDPPNPTGPNKILEMKEWKQLDIKDPGKYKVFVKGYRNLAEYALAIQDKKI